MGGRGWWGDGIGWWWWDGMGVGMGVGMAWDGMVWSGW